MATFRDNHGADPGALVSRTHETARGTRVRLRLVRPSDAARVADLLPDGDDIARLTHYDPRRRMVLAATRPGRSGEQLVGIGEVDFEDGARTVETNPGEGVEELLAHALDHLARARAA